MYEGMFVLEATLEGASLDKATAEINESITTNGGEVIESQVLGKRRLAYEIGGKQEATYYRIVFSIDPANVIKITAANKMKEAVLRNMIVKEKR